jgi:hypothetical protein
VLLKFVLRLLLPGKRLLCLNKPRNIKHSLNMSGKVRLYALTVTMLTNKSIAFIQHASKKRKCEGEELGERGNKEKDLSFSRCVEIITKILYGQMHNQEKMKHGRKHPSSLCFCVISSAVCETNTFVI